MPTSTVSQGNLELWPPGTVRLEDIFQNKENEIILSPTPSSDPNDPLNWARWRKDWNFALCCLYALMVFAVTNATTPTWAPMNLELGFSYSLLNDSYAIGCATLAFGAFLMIPFALKFGRRPMYIISILAQFAISIWSAKIETVADLMLTNALGCGVGALSEVIVQMTVKDLFFVHQRGLMNSIYIWMSGVGQTLVPLPAGYITESEGWRWVWWWNAILFGVCIVFFVFGYEETKFSPPLIVQSISEVSCSQVQEESVETPSELQEKSPVNEWEAREDVSPTVVGTREIDFNIPKRTYRQKFAFSTTTEGGFEKFVRHSYQPVTILFTFPAVFYMSLVYGVTTAWSTVVSYTSTLFLPLTKLSITFPFFKMPKLTINSR